MFFYIEDQSELVDEGHYVLPQLCSTFIEVEVLGKVNYDQPILQDLVKVYVPEDYISKLSKKLKEVYGEKYPHAEIVIVKKGPDEIA